MPRNMSFMLTTDQIRSRTKIVTRRVGWKFLKPGDVLWACEKCQGLRPGEKINRLCKIRVTSVSQEQLCRISQEDVWREGFSMSPVRFVEFFCSHMKCDPTDFVNRIEFEYVGQQPKD